MANNNKETGKNIGIFAGGFLFGTAGLALLGSRGAKNLYAHTTAGLMRAKDATLNWVSNLQANAGDVAAEAKAINQKKKEKKEAENKACHIVKADQADKKESEEKA
jgi:hypothetical protein